MTEVFKANECADPTQNFIVELPCRMVERKNGMLSKMALLLGMF